MNHESVHTQYYVDRITRHWTTEYLIDGFRFDFTKGLSNTWHSNSDSWGSNFDATRVRIEDLRGETEHYVRSSLMSLGLAVDPVTMNVATPDPLAAITTKRVH